MCQVLTTEIRHHHLTNDIDSHTLRIDQGLPIGRHFFGKIYEGEVIEIVQETNIKYLPGTTPGMLYMLYYIILTIFWKVAIMNPFYRLRNGGYEMLSQIHKTTK